MAARRRARLKTKPPETGGLQKDSFASYEGRTVQVGNYNQLTGKYTCRPVDDPIRTIDAPPSSLTPVSRGGRAMGSDPLATRRLRPLDAGRELHTKIS